ncbi:hypothetical protein [Oryza sativa Japonica Group]|uniref:Uncharacterized protein n=1 Tax=Oryza sativa subsp. japonica TaxID=39947 RepID=Q5ZD65_ORYSJ|nr:hypothetical protein [Oryza sativa Japonica Group]
MSLPVKHVMVSSTTIAGSTGGEVPATASAPSAIAGTGFVQGLVTYAVMDDLKVAPMSTIALVKSGVTHIKSLQEKTGLAMLKASLQSKTVLTDVFLGKKRKKWPFVLVLLLLFILLAGKPQA